MSHVSNDDDGRSASAALSPRAARVVLVVGLVLALASVAGYVAIVFWVVREARPQVGMAIVATTLGLAIGAVLIGLADVSRRRVGRAVQTFNNGLATRRSFEYRVRPVAPGWQVLWLALLVVGYVLLVPVQLGVGVLSERPLAMLPAVVILLPGLASAGGAGSVAVSLVKKLTFPGQARRHPDAPPGGPVVRTALYLWRIDIYLGMAAGIVGGSASIPWATGHPAAGMLLGAAALVLIAGAVALALQFWRTGAALDDAVLAAPRTAYTS